MFNMNNVYAWLLKKLKMNVSKIRSQDILNISPQDLSPRVFLLQHIFSHTWKQTLFEFCHSIELVQS